MVSKRATFGGAVAERDWLGRGGLMGFPFVAFPKHLAGVFLRVRVYALSALWLCFAFQYFVWQLPLVPLMLIPDGGAAYKRACTWFDWLAQPATLAIPFSWCGFRVHTSQYALMKTMSSEGCSVVMTNHGSRVDWLVGMLLCSTVAPVTRMGFVAEVTMGLMPVFGWSRALFGDIFLRRTFHRDAERIRENIAAFHAAKVSRMIFVAAEGAIVDPGVPKDEEYVEQCDDFMRSLGKAPLRYLLTPRYKGVQLLTSHAPKAVFSVTMAFATRGDEGGDRRVRVCRETQRAEGGVLCSKPLSDKSRIVPDLHTIFRGGLHVFCDIAKLDLKPDAPSATVKETLVADYERKDRLLANFHKTRTFDDDDDDGDARRRPATSSYEMRQLAVPHARMNFTLAAQLFLSHKALAWLGFPLARVLPVCLISWFSIFVLHAVTHFYAEQISGASRESLVFETVLKMLIQKFSGGLNHGGSSKPKAAVVKLKLRAADKAD